MTLQNFSQPSSDLSPSDQLLTVVLHYQQIYRDWSVEVDKERRAALRDALHRCQEDLWPLLAAPLLIVARGWLRSGMAQDMCASPTSYPDVENVLCSLAMNLYIHIVDALPQLQVDRDKNLLACLKLIARRGMFDENLRIYRAVPRQSNARATEQTIAPGTRSAQMWPEHRRSNAHMRDNLHEAEPVDPDTVDFESQLVTALDQRTCCQAVWTFWQTLAGEDQQIVQLRWNHEPSVPFETIAQQFGPGWTAGTVRQRHCRILQRTRTHLQELGLIDRAGFSQTAPDA